MSIASKISERFRNRLQRIVAKERALVGCATLAVKRVASKLRMSPATVYRAMNGYGEPQIKAHHYVALLMIAMGGAAAAKFRKSAKSHQAELSA